MVTRYPRGTPYAGALVPYDDQMTRDELIWRLVHGRPRPMLARYERPTGAFYGRLLEHLANAHGAYIKRGHMWQMRHLIADLEDELPADRFRVDLVRDPEDPPRSCVRLLMVFNRVNSPSAPPVMQRAWHDEHFPTNLWCDTREAGRILQLSPESARRLAVKYGAVAENRIGGRSQVMIRRDMLATMANRPKRQRRGKRVRSG